MVGAVGGLLASRELLRTLVERQLRLRAKRAVLGTLWPMVAPLFLFLLFVFVFRRVFSVPIERYPVFLFAGLLPWGFLAQSLGQAITSLSNEAELIRRAPFPYELLPVASVMGMFFYFFITLAGFVAYLGATGQLEPELLPVLVAPIAALLLLVLGLALLIALLDVYNRDLRQVLNNLLTVWFFLVPIVYRHEMVPRPLRFLRSVDPMNMIVGQFRDVLYWGGLSRPAHLAYMLGVCTGVFAAALALFRRFSPNLPKDV